MEKDQLLISKVSADDVVCLLDVTYFLLSESTEDCLLLDEHKNYFFNALSQSAIAGQSMIIVRENEISYDGHATYLGHE